MKNLVTLFLLLTEPKGKSNLSLQSVQSAQPALLEQLREKIRGEVFGLAFRILLGAVLASMASFSAIQVGYAVWELLSALENANLIKIVTFSMVALVSLSALYLLLRSRRVLVRSKEIAIVESEIDVRDIALSFVRGFIVGISKPSRQQQVEERSFRPVD